MMFSMMLSSSFVREVPAWLDWARSMSVMGLLADVSMYYEFRDIEEKGADFGTGDQVFESNGLRVRTPDDAMGACLILGIIFLVSRIIAFFSVKFLHTGQTLKENLWE